MSYFKSVKNAAIKTKLRGDVTLLNRETTARKQKLGVELYNLLVILERNSRKAGGVSIKSPTMFHAKQDSIKVPLDACRADVGVLEDRKEGMEQELVHMAANRDRARLARTNGESLQQAGKWVSDSGVEAKIQVQMRLIDREIYQRKERFGLEVYDDIISASNTSKTSGAGAADTKEKTGLFGGVKAGISNRLSKLSSDETAIEECIDKAKKDVNLIQSKIDRKDREIAQLDEE